MGNGGVVEKGARVGLGKSAAAGVFVFEGSERRVLDGMVEGGEEVGIRVVDGSLRGHGRQRSICRYIWILDICEYTSLSVVSRDMATGFLLRSYVSL